MSTRANIVVKSGREKLIFYRHSDGYPEGTMPLLEKFMAEIKAGNLRDNVGQSAGWLVEYGRREMLEFENEMKKQISSFQGYGWKVGFIEPTTCIHGDIEYLYTIDLANKKITVRKK